MTNREVCIIHAVEKLTNEKEWWSLCADANVCERWKQEMLAMDWPAVVDLRFADFTAEMADAVSKKEPRISVHPATKSAGLSLLDLLTPYLRSSESCAPRQTFTKKRGSSP
jgi:hypothetical protein